MDIGRTLGHYTIEGRLGEGGPPSLNAAFGRSSGEVSPKPSTRTR